MQIVAKFMLTEILHQHYGSVEYYTFKFHPQYDQSLPEDLRFSKATPTGSFEMSVDNLPVREFLKQNLGKQFKLLLMPVEEDGEAP